MPTLRTDTDPRPSFEDFKALADCIPNLAWMADSTGWIFWYNSRWYEYTGKTPAEMEGWGWQSVHDPTELPRVMDGWKKAIASGEPFEMEFPLRNANNEFKWFLTRVMPSKDKDGKITRWFGTNTDIHELRLAQVELRANAQRFRMNEERLRLMQKAAKVAAWEFHFDEEHFVLTTEAYELLGQEMGAFNPSLKSILSLMYFSTDRENLESALKAATKSKKALDTNFRILTKNKEVRWISAKGKTFFNQGEALMLGLFVDMTEAMQHSAEVVEKAQPRRVAKPR